MPKLACHKCFNNEDLKKYIKAHGELGTCDYCHSRAKAHYVSEIADHIESCLNREWSDPVHCAMYIGSEGGYQVPTYDTDDVLASVGFDVDSLSLYQDILRGIENSLWCQNEPYVLSEGEEMIHTWEQFCDLVKHQCRYMFLGYGDREAERSHERVLISDILHHLSQLFIRYKLFTTIKRGTTFYRVRKFDNFPLTKEELGPPPSDKAISSRMSPAGISMFYSAKESETALKETKIKSDEQYALAKFELAKDILVIDLTKVPSLPSIFSEKKAGLRDDISFLRKFLSDFTKEIKRDGREHIDYVPTQIVSEFCKYKVTYKKKAVFGFIYPSAQAEGGTSYCLYLSRENFGIQDTEMTFCEPEILMECKSVFCKTC